MIRTNKIIPLLSLLLLLFSCKSPSEKQQPTGAEIIKSIDANNLSGITQVLVVYNKQANDYQATLLAFEKTEQGWKQVFDEIPAGIGENGFAPVNEKVEGDGKSPTGVFALGQMFTYLDSVDSKLPYQKLQLKTNGSTILSRKITTVMGRAKPMPDRTRICC